MISKTCFKNDLILFSWLLLIVYAFYCGFDLLSFLLTCLALLLSIFALPQMRPNSIAQETSSMKEKNEDKEEPMIQENTIEREEDPDPDPTQECSDGSISDEESLIEIALPSGSYIDTKKPLMRTSCGIQQKWWADCYSIESFIAEISELYYEEENMIEIDLSMGSIKCPRFEIKA